MHFHAVEDKTIRIVKLLLNMDYYMRFSFFFPAFLMEFLFTFNTKNYNAGLLTELPTVPSILSPSCCCII